jgi:hypothetical protein
VSRIFGTNKYAYDEVIGEMRLFKKVIRKGLREYFASPAKSANGNNQPMQEMVNTPSNTHSGFVKLEKLLRDLNLPNYHHELVKLAFSIAIDLGEREQKMVSKMLKKCVKRGLLEDSDIQHGFAIILGRLDDYSLDVPKANELCAKMMSECVSDEVLSADLIKKEQILEYGGTSGVEVLQNVLH